MKTYTLTLTEEQANILGFALAKVSRQQAEQGAEFNRLNRGAAADGCYERRARIDEVRDLLDCCPVTEG